MRKKLENVKAFTTTANWIELKEGQYFCHTPKAYEIWQEYPLMRLKRIANSRVFWVHEK